MSASVLLAAWVAITAAPNAELDRATRQVDDLQYSEAQKSLEAAWKKSGNDRQTTLRILELQGVVAATLNDGARAAKLFAMMLSLEPERKLTGDHPPRVMTPYYEARGRVAEMGRLSLERGEGVTATVRDALKLAKKVRFHLRRDGVWSVVTSDIVNGVASAPVQAMPLDWWAEAISDREAILVSAASEAAPWHEGPSDAPRVAVVPQVQVMVAPQVVVVERHGSPLRPVAWVAAGAGVVALGVGVAFGVMSNAARSKIDGASTDPSGNITGVTQREAYELDRKQRSNATIANAMYLTAGALAATSVALFVISRDSATTVALVPTGSGAALTGVFP